MPAARGTGAIREVEHEHSRLVRALSIQPRLRGAGGSAPVDARHSVPLDRPRGERLADLLRQAEQDPEALEPALRALDAFAPLDRRSVLASLAALSRPTSVQSGHDEGSVQSAHPLPRTNAEKREAELALLRSDAGKFGIERLSDCEIARQAGVSPQIVGSIRRSLA